MSCNPNMSHLYASYIPFTDHVLTSWDIQVVTPMAVIIHHGVDDFSGNFLQLLIFRGLCWCLGISAFGMGFKNRTLKEMSKWLASNKCFETRKYLDGNASNVFHKFVSWIFLVGWVGNDTISLKMHSFCFFHGFVVTSLKLVVKKTVFTILMV